MTKFTDNTEVTVDADGMINNHFREIGRKGGSAPCPNRKYQSNAERQQAYRDRKRKEQSTMKKLRYVVVDHEGRLMNWNKLEGRFIGTAYGHHATAFVTVRSAQLRIGTMMETLRAKNIPTTIDPNRLRVLTLEEVQR